MHRSRTIRKIVLSVAPWVLATAITSQGPVAAAPMAFVAKLAGANENPPTTSTGAGTAIVIVDPAANTMGVSVTCSGLASGNPAAHIHSCAATAGAIDAVFASGNAPADFVGLLSLPADQLPDILERIAGQNESAVAQAGHESIRQFLALVLNPFAGTRPAQQPLLAGGTLWGAVYGSHMRLEGRPFQGFHTD